MVDNEIITDLRNVGRFFYVSLYTMLRSLLELYLETQAPPPIFNR